MKTKLCLIIIGLISSGRVGATATFDQLAPNAHLSSGYSEGGITFTSPSGFYVAGGYYDDVLFGGGVSPHPGNVLYSNNTGWVGIASPGNLLSSVYLRYGFDWDFYTIEYGLMDVNVEWEEMLNGQVIGQGGSHFDRDHRSHGDGGIGVSGLFDTLLVRSTAVAYKPIPWAGPNPHGWYYDRGEAVDYGETNHIAIDDVDVTLAAIPDIAAAPLTEVPDAGPSFELGLMAMIGLVFARHCLKHH